MKQDKLSLEQYHDYLNKKLKETIDHAYHNSPAIKRRMDASGVKPSDIKTFGDLEKIPIVTRDEMVRLQAEDPPFGGFLAQPLEEQRMVVFSPGPLYASCDWEQKLTTMLEGLEPCNIGKGDLIINAFTYHMVPLAHFLEYACGKIGATIIPTGTGNTELQVKIMHDLGVTGYFGTARFLDTIIKKAEEMGYDFRRDFRLRFCMTAADIFPKALKQSFIKDYGIRVVDIIGTAEAGVSGTECEYNSGWHLIKDIIVEIVDPVTKKCLGPGEIGEIVYTNFDKTFPFIRFGTGDLSRLDDTPCPCGNVTPRLMGLLGRVGEAIKLRGMFVHPRDLGGVLAKFPQLTKYQLLIDQVGGKDFATLKVEGVYEENISQEIYNGFAEICRVRLDNVEFVSPGAIPADAKIIVDQRAWK